MSQHDLTIDNQGFPAFRADLNNALQALGSTQSGTSAPSPTFANQLWYDTTNNQLKIRNEDNDAWITLLTLDQVADAVSTITGSTINAGTLAASGNVSFDGGTFVFNDSGADRDFRIEGDTDPNLLFTDASTDRVGIGTNTPSYKLDVQGNIGSTIASKTAMFDAAGGSIFSSFNDGTKTWRIGAGIQTAGQLSIRNATDSLQTLEITSAGVVELPVGQLKFPASQNASSNANTLDDYEEGEWTPTLRGSTVVGTTTYSTQNGLYIKIGRFVYLVGTIQYTSMTGTGNLLIGNFPFSNTANRATTGYIMTDQLNWPDGRTSPILYCGGSENFARIYVSGDNVGWIPADTETGQTIDMHFTIMLYAPN